MTDLGVDFLGVHFKNPIVVTACSLANSAEGVLRLAGTGVGGVITKSISAELLPAQELVYMEHRGMQWVPSDQRILVDDAVAMIPRIKGETDVPLIANLISFADDTDKWTELARAVAEAGADIIEIDLNAHLTEGQRSSAAPENALFHAPSIGSEPAMVQRVVAAVKGAVNIPVITKMCPLTSDLISIAQAAIAGGTDGLSLLNALGGLPGVDVRNEGRPLYDGFESQGVSQLIGDAVAPQALLHTAHFGKLFDTPLLSGGGVMTSEQAVERLMLGAELVGICAILYRDGIEAATEIVAGLARFLELQGYRDLDEVRGVALPHVGRSEFWAFSGSH